MQRVVLAFVFLVSSFFVLYLLVLQEIGRDPMSETQFASPVCQALPARGPARFVSVLLSRTVDRPGIVCVRLYNGTEQVFYYEGNALRLQRRWLGFVWLLYIPLSSELLSPGPRSLSLRQPELMPGVADDTYLPTAYDPALAGRYRIRFCYRAAPESREQQCVYSKRFSLP
jgi:hypothetical protein